MLTQAELKEQLYYDPLSGIFTWLTDSSKGGFKAGRICNCTDVHGYIQININGSPKKAHRLAWLYMTGEFPKGQIDHINHIRTDNRFSNLRVVNNQENHQNRPMQKNNTSGFVGVYLYKRTGKYLAYIQKNGIKIHLGIFHNIDDAILARKNANIEHGFSDLHGIGYGVKKYKRY